MSKREGHVVWFNDKLGYGFISCDDFENDLFVHFSKIEGEGFKTLDKGEVVSFIEEPTEQGYQATAVERK